MSITKEKHEVLVRTAHYFLRERHIHNCPMQFDVVAIENTPGQPPAVRLHKATLSPQLPRVFIRDRTEIQPLTSIEVAEEYNTMIVGVRLISRGAAPAWRVCIAGTTEGPDYRALGHHFHRSWKTSDGFSKRKRFPRTAAELSLLPRE
jgi:Holliday junction resolvase-like predicted endonuclease